MYIFLSLDALGPNLTGIGRYSWELATRLPQTISAENIRFLRHGRWVSAPSTLLLSWSKQSSIWKSILHLISPPRCLKRLRLKHACRGSIFHGPNYFIPDYADIGIATVHDLSIFKFPETHPAERISQFEREFQRTLDKASHLITDSEAIRLEVIDTLNWPEDRITAVPLGVSSEFGPMPSAALRPCMRKYGLTEGGYTLCVSTLEPRKRIDNLLLAYQALPRDLRTRFPLVLAGSPGWLSEALRERVELYSRQGWVRYLGFVPEAELPALYAGARLFAFPSVYEGFGLPVLEAMASGIPVVTSNCSSLPEITQGAALLADPDNVDELGAFIVKGLCDDDWRSAARFGGLSVAETYTWENCVEETVRVYEYVAEKHSLLTLIT